MMASNNNSGGGNVGFASAPSASPPTARAAAAAATTASSPTTASAPTTTQLEFKNWFFHTATFNHQEAARPTSPKQLKKVLRRAWKALERSPYYKTLRSGGEANGSPGDLALVESGVVSRSAPGSPPTSAHRRFKKNKARSHHPKSALVKRRGSSDLLATNNSSGDESAMRPATASQKVRPFSAGSVGSTSSSEGSEVAAAGADDASRRLIPKKGALFPSAKVRPKSSGILRNAQPDIDGAQGRNVYFSNVDETAANGSSGGDSSPSKQQGAADGNQAKQISAASRRTSSAASAGSRKSLSGGEAGGSEAGSDAASGKVKFGGADSSSAGATMTTQMVIDSSNAGDVAQLGSIPEMDGGKQPLKRKGSAGGKGGTKQPFADLKVIDETASTKSGGSGKGSNKSSSKQSDGGKAGSGKGSTSSGGSSSTNKVKPAVEPATPKTPTTTATLAPPSGAKDTSSSSSPTPAGSNTRLPLSPATSIMAASVSILASGAAKGDSSSTTATSSTPGGLTATSSSDDKAGDSRFSTADAVDGDGASSKGSKTTDKSEKSSSKDGGTTAPKSSLKKTQAETKETKDTKESAKDKPEKETKAKDSSSNSTKDSGKDKESKDSKETSGSKEKEGKGGKKSDKKSDDKKASENDASKQPDAAAVTTQPTPGTGAQPEGGAPAAGEEGGAGGKAPLRREMSRISVKTNESRKSIDMSKHIMNLIHGGQNQEEQAKKPQTTNQSYIQQAIPALPMAGAVICLMLNLFAPGCGTILSGLLVLCVGKPRIEAKENALGLTIFVNSFVGISQLMTVTFFFVGWFWSMVWGINLIINSIEYRAEQKAEREKELQQTAMRAFGFIRADAAPVVDE